jgi:hypothetical protein
MSCTSRTIMQVGTRYGSNFATAEIGACALTIAIACCGVARADQGLLPYTATIPRTQEGDNLRLAAFELIRYDSNFFHLPDQIDPGDGGRREAVTSTTGIGLSYDKYYGLQHIVLDASLSRDRYGRASNLDFTSYAIDANYYWKLTPDVSGAVTFNRTYLPTDYEYIGFVTTPDPRTTQTARASIDWRAGAGLHPRFSIIETEYRNRTSTFQLENSRGSGLEVAAVYRFRTNNRLEAYVDESRGRSLDSVSNPLALTNTTYTQREYGIRYHAEITDIVNVDGHAAYFKREFSDFPIRDFGGPVGDLNLFYAVTGKTQLLASVSRTLYGAQTNFSNYFVEDDASIGVLWMVTGKITVHPSYTVRRQAYQASPFPVETPLREISRYAMLEVDWAALRSLDISLSVTHSTRSATESTLQFGDRSASVFARLKF